MTHSASSSVATQAIVGFLKLIGAEGIVDFFGLEGPDKKVLKEIAQNGQTVEFFGSGMDPIRMKVGGKNKEQG